MTQKQRMLGYLQEHGSITTMQAFLDLGNCSPRKAISQLRRDGHKIIDTTISGVDRYGEKCHWKRYTLIEGAHEQ